MACPKCGCKTVYQFDDEDDPHDDMLQRCAACGEVFDLDDEAEEDDEPPEAQPGATDFDGADAWNAYGKRATSWRTDKEDLTHG